MTAGFALIGLCAFVAYWPALQGGFTWDDDSVLSQNGLIRASDGLWRLWTTAEATDYWPVTNSLMWAEWRLFGAHPLGYHLVDLGLHVAIAGLIWRVIEGLGFRGGLFAALLFAVHPVNVESVAWIAQTKTLVAAVLFLLSIGCFSRSEAGLNTGERRRFLAWYGLSLVAFALAMLSKGSVAMLPLVLLGLIAWRRPVSVRDLVRLAPFFAVACVLSAVNVWFQRHGTLEVIRDAGLTERALGAGAVVWFYLGKALWPAKLIFVYPQWHIDARDWVWWIPLVSAVALSAALTIRRRVPVSPPKGGGGKLPRERPWADALLAAWLYFCIMLVPVMGFTDVYFMKYALVADHYAYVALIGIVACAAFAWDRWVTRGRLAIAAAVVAVLGVLTWRQCRDYRDPETLFRATVAKNPHCWMALDQLGVAAYNRGRIDEAIAYYERALRVGKDLYETHNYLGNALLAADRVPEAIGHYQEALRLKPDYADAHHNLGAALTKQGSLDEAIAHFAEALRLYPDFPEAHNDLGVALARKDRWPDALAQFETAVRLRPDYAEAIANRAAALAEQAHRR